MASERDIYTTILERDFTLITFQVNYIEGQFDRKPWISDNCPYKPYCIFWRKNGIVKYCFSEGGMRWIKSELKKQVENDQGFIAHVVEEFDRSFEPIQGLLDKEEALPIDKLKQFCDDCEMSWSWLEAVWWLIDLYEELGDQKMVDQLLESRKRHERFVPLVDVIVRKTLEKQYPKIGKYIEVILLDEAVSGNIPDKAVLEKRYDEYFYTEKQLFVGEGKEYFENKYGIEFEEHDTSGQVGEIKGTSAYPGKVEGKVCIIYSVKDVHKMDQGDILVAPTTLPDFMPAIQKAGAMVANEGGMLSHASIVSRELKIPCVIGTKIATKVFKDGDVVEVDADNGVVRIVNKV
jgi:phosphohistidine swiveling domain-containing protein